MSYPSTWYPPPSGSRLSFGARYLSEQTIDIDDGHAKVEQVETGLVLGPGNPLGLPVLLWSCYGFGLLLQVIDVLIGVADRPLHQTMHDKSAGTLVIQAPPAPAGAGRPDEHRPDGGTT